MKDEIVVVGGRTEQLMGSRWNKQELILSAVGHCLLYLIAIAEHHLCGHLGVNTTIASIPSQAEKKHLQTANGSITDRNNTTIPSVFVYRF